MNEDVKYVQIYIDENRLPCAFQRIPAFTLGALVPRSFEATEAILQSKLLKNEPIEIQPIYMRGEEDHLLLPTLLQHFQTSTLKLLFNSSMVVTTRDVHNIYLLLRSELASRGAL